MSRQVTGCTGLLCLLGSPVAHSISPAMHNEACALLDLDYTYLAFDVAPDRLAEAVEGLKALGVRGFNVTMPHKTAAAALCERLSPAARICGAVNTVVNEGGSLVGHTTDGEGYMRSAREAGFQPEGKRMVQLGAGGAGTAVLVQAALDGMAAIDVFNTRDAFWPRAERVAAELERGLPVPGGPPRSGRPGGAADLPGAGGPSGEHHAGGYGADAGLPDPRRLLAPRRADRVGRDLPAPGRHSC